ncbi:MAG: cytochrome P460 family protein [Gemmataceae bacterium]|nr:cytochrome P460 family protein [Gemmataceae bacterium]
MTSSRPRYAYLVAIALAAVVGGLGHWSGSVPWTQPAAAAEPDAFSPYVDAKGNISLPTDYKTTFVHLGTFAVAGKTKVGAPVDSLHGVYARPEDVTAFQRDGKFPDGAVIVKDVLKVKSDALTTGTVTWATDVDVWFVMIKDSKGRFKDNELWGDGWGWALYQGKDPKKQVATDYKTDCRACHVPAKADDWLYLRGYPVLKEKPKGK